MKENSIKNERSSIEEDIKVLENLLDEGFEAMCYEEAQAIEHILSDYKRVLESNEVLLKENEKKDELIEKMRKYLLKENKMCDFLESED